MNQKNVSLWLKSWRTLHSIVIHRIIHTNLTTHDIMMSVDIQILKKLGIYLKKLYNLNVVRKTLL